VILTTPTSANLITQASQSVWTTFRDSLTGQVRDHNTWLFFCFAVYVVLIFAFAALYHIVYLRRTSNFIFASDIRKTAVTDFHSKASVRIEQIEAGVQIIQELRETIKNNDDFLDAAKRANVFDLPCGWKCRVYRRILLLGGSPLGGKPKLPGVIGGVTVYTKEDARWFDVPLTGLVPDSMVPEPDWMKRLTGAEEKLTEEMKDLERRLQSISSPHPEVWSFWDFLYFSTITQTTVGYGDILPNSTVVRMIVVCQILCGYAVIAIAINVVFFQ
jgi:hypothetical protein